MASSCDATAATSSIPRVRYPARCYDQELPMKDRIISADSHVTETPDVYKPRMAAKFRDQAPYVIYDEEKGDLFVIPGMKATAVPVGLIAGAGKKAEELSTFRARFDDLHHGGWDPELRL